VPTSANDKGAYAEFAHILSGYAGNRSWNRFGFDAQQTAEASRLETKNSTKGKTPKNCPNLKTPVHFYHCIPVLLIRARIFNVYGTESFWLVELGSGII
jgi:hypothetical protein